MKLNYLCYAVLAIVLVVTVKGAPLENDFKEEFAQKLGLAIKEPGIQLFQDVIKTVKTFYETVLDKASPSAEEIIELNKNKKELDELSKNIENMKSKELVIEIQNFAKNKLLKMAEFKENADKANDTKKSEIIANSLEVSGANLKEAGKKFSNGLCEKWTEMFKKIPKTELDKFPEYQRINELVLELRKVPGGSLSFFNVLKALIQFFEYNDWNFLLEIENQIILSNA